MNSLKRVSLDKKSPEEDEEAAAKVGDGALRLPPFLLFFLKLLGMLFAPGNLRLAKRLSITRYFPGIMEPEHNDFVP